MNDEITKATSDHKLHLPSSSSQRTTRQASTSGNHLSVCVAIDMTAAFDTVSHDTLISKIVGSSLPPAISRWLTCYMRGRQLASEVPSRARETSAPASFKD